jgi:8-amino-7-oxononanoate synthase
MSSLDQYAIAELEALEQRHMRRQLAPTHRHAGLWVERQGKTLLSFSCNDYLGLAHDPRVINAAQDAIALYGAGAGASRLISGNYPLLEILEQKLAALKGTETACVFGSGYLANTGIISTLIGKGDLILLDEWVHSCIWSGARLSGARIMAFRHNDMMHVQSLLSQHRSRFKNCLIAVDGVYSMDGDKALLPALATLAPDYDAWLLCDDAHGAGVIGGGRGTSFDFDAPIALDLNMGTLSKAFGSYGGYVCASSSIIHLLKTRAASFVYSTALPAASAGAACAALDIIRDEPERSMRPLRLAQRFTQALHLPLAQSAIVPVIIGQSETALMLSRAMEDKGFLVVAIRPPTVPDGTARLRFTFSAAHQESDIDDAAQCLTDLLRQHQIDLSAA